jgi:hypothetical protein
MTNENQPTDKQLHKPFGTTFEKLEQHTHIQDQISDKDDDHFDEELDEEYLPVWYFPSNVYYKMLGVDFILAKHNLNPDPVMFPLYEKFADEILDPQDAFNLKQNEINLEVDLEPH